MDHQERIPVALFDFDGTLLAGDSIVWWLRFCVRKGIAPRRQWLKAGAGYILQRFRPSQVTLAKQMSLSYLKGRTVREMDALAEEFMQQEIRKRLYPDAVREMRKLSEEGFRIIVITASPSVYMRMLPVLLPVHTVLATPCLETDGRYTGKVGPNCRGEQKIVRWDAWRDSRMQAVRAYGDSRSDLPMLRLAEEPCLVNADAKLKEKLPQARCVEWHQNEV